MGRYVMDSSHSQRVTISSVHQPSTAIPARRSLLRFNISSFQRFLPKPRPHLSAPLVIFGLLFIFIALLLDVSIFTQFTADITTPIRKVTHSLSGAYSTWKMSSALPPTKKELGNAGWTFIHSIAANFPEEPTESEQRHAKNFLKSIGKLYPCKKCRYHFASYIIKNPPDVSSRESLVLWACGAHNAVNRRNGEEEFPCDIASLDARWKDCGCKVKQKAAQRAAAKAHAARVNSHRRSGHAA